jgi:peptidoglycan/xylan/chitin deacetylase (PgdA/CDA1 family)
VTPEEVQTGRLLLGLLGLEDVVPNGRALERAVRSRPVPAEPVRLAEALALKGGILSLERRLIKPMAAGRREALGDGVAAEPPRILVRVDEFPHAQVWDEPERYGNEAFRRLHRILRDAGVPYLLAVTSRPCHAYLDPSAKGERPITAEERELLAEAFAEGAEPASHGLTHRTRVRRPRHRSELRGLSDHALTKLLTRADAELEAAGIRARIFVPPFNRFDARQFPVLAERFEVVCGGPESVPLISFLRGPVWRGETVYFPSYPPLYGRAGAIEAALGGLTANAAGLWLQLTLHLGWEADDGFEALPALAEAVAPYARPWSEFLAAVESSRGT